MYANFSKVSKSITFVVLRVHAFIKLFMGRMLRFYDIKLLNQAKLYPLDL